MPAPNHSIFVNTITKFVVGFGLAGGAVWKGWSMVGGDHHDHEALERTSNAKEMEKCASSAIASSASLPSLAPRRARQSHDIVSSLT